MAVMEVAMLRLVDAAVAENADDRAFYLNLVTDAASLKLDPATNSIDATGFLFAACGTITVAVELAAKIGGVPRDELYAAVREWCLTDRLA